MLIKSKQQQKPEYPVESAIVSGKLLLSILESMNQYLRLIMVEE